MATLRGLTPPHADAASEDGWDSWDEEAAGNEALLTEACDAIAALQRAVDSPVCQVLHGFKCKPDLVLCCR